MPVCFSGLRAAVWWWWLTVSLCFSGLRAATGQLRGGGGGFR